MKQRREIFTSLFSFVVVLLLLHQALNQRATHIGSNIWVEGLLDLLFRVGVSLALVWADSILWLVSLLHAYWLYSGRIPTLLLWLIFNIVELKALGGFAHLLLKFLRLLLTCSFLFLLQIFCIFFNRCLCSYACYFCGLATVKHPWNNEIDNLLFLLSLFLIGVHHVAHFQAYALARGFPHIRVNQILVIKLLAKGTLRHLGRAWFSSAAGFPQWKTVAFEKRHSKITCSDEIPISQGHWLQVFEDGLVLPHWIGWISSKGLLLCLAYRAVNADWAITLVIGNNLQLSRVYLKLHRFVSFSQFSCIFIAIRHDVHQVVSINTSF